VAYDDFICIEVLRKFAL